jgi:hypothetical protein
MNSLCADALSIPYIKFITRGVLTLHPFPFSKDVFVPPNVYPIHSIPVPYRKRDSDEINHKQLDAI